MLESEGFVLMSGSVVCQLCMWQDTTHGFTTVRLTAQQGAAQLQGAAPVTKAGLNSRPAGPDRRLTRTHEPMYGLTATDYWPVC